MLLNLLDRPLLIALGLRGGDELLRDVPETRTPWFMR